jgi:hypothetical protein
MFDGELVVWSSKFDSLLQPSHHPQSRSLLIWSRRLIDHPDVFRDCPAGQFINRIPRAKYLSRKAAFTALIQRMQFYFPETYSFIPESYILPTDEPKFKAALVHGLYIVKPDNGSLGAGISFLNSPDDYQTPARLSVAQRYISSIPYNNRKFDLRVYALICLNPLRIYVNREGLARFCADPYDSEGMFAKITNTAVNKQKELNLENITKPITDIFPQICGSYEKVAKLWDRIDHIVILTIIAALPFLTRGFRDVKDVNFFQLFGFDILLGQNLKPIVLEVNYRPSLSPGTPAENAMKEKMITDIFQIILSQDVREKYRERPEFAESVAIWDAFLGSVSEDSRFAMVYPATGMDQYKPLLARSWQIPTMVDVKTRCPVRVRKPERKKEALQGLGEWEGRVRGVNIMTTWDLLG